MCSFFAVNCWAPAVVDCSPTLSSSALAPLNISVTDPDGAAYTTLQFFIASGNVNNAFAINPSTGILSVNRALDYTVDPHVFYLSLIVSDGKYNSTFTINVSITNVIHPPIPIQSIYNVTINEKMPRGTSVVQVSFASLTGNELTYSLSDSTYFMVNASTGLIMTNRVFDYEVDSKLYVFTVFASDLKNSPVLTGIATIIVTLLPINDERPIMNITLISGRVYYQQTPPITFADVIVQHLDIFPIYYATVHIENAANMAAETLSISLPANFKVAYNVSTNLLTIVGAATAFQYSAFLSNVTYYNGADRLEMPLERSIVFSVCDQLPPSLATLTNDTVAALTGGSVLSSSLSSADVSILISSCPEFTRGSLTLPLVRVNHRPVITAPIAVFKSILEDIPDTQNLGQPVVDVFGPAISDVDVFDPKGIAISSASGSGVWQMSQNKVQRSVNSQWMSTVTLSVSPLGVAVFNRYPSSVINLTSAMLQLANGSMVDITTDLISGSSFSVPDLGIANASLLLTDVLWLQVTVLGVAKPAEPFSSAVASYVSLGNVSNTAATLVGPYSLLRFQPSLLWYGEATLGYYAWDYSNGLVSGTLVMDVSLTTAFSLSQGLATLTVTYVNHAPTLDLNTTSKDYYTSYTENSPPVFVTSNPILEDTDSSFLTDLYVNISAIGGTCVLPGFAENSLDQLISVNISAMTSLIVTNSFTRTGQACISYHYAGNLTLDQWKWFITMLAFQVTNNEPSNHTRQLQFEIGGGTVFSPPAYTFITVHVVTDQCPVLSLSLMTLSYLEHGGAYIIDAGLNVTDADIYPLLMGATVAISEPSMCLNCHFLATQLPASITQITGNGTLTLHGPASPEDFQTALRSVVFSDYDPEPATLFIGVQFTIFVPAMLTCPSASGHVIVMINPVDDFAPIIYLNSPAQNFSTRFIEGNTSQVALTSNFVLIVDNDHPISMSYQVTVQIVTGCISSEDSLTLQSPSTLVQSYNSTSCTLKLQGNQMGLQNDLMKLKYTNVKRCNITGGVRIIQFKIYAVYVENSTTSSTTLSVITVNDPPIIYLGGMSSMNSIVYFTDSATTVSLVPRGVTASISDCNSATLSSLVLTITEYTSTEQLVSPRSDVQFESILLRGSISANIVVNPYDQITGVLQLTGTATLAEYSAALNNLLYSNVKVPPTNNLRKIIVVASNWEGVGEVSTVTVIVTNTTIPPIVDLNGSSKIGIDNQVTYTLTDPAISIAPAANVTDPNGLAICSARLVLTGQSATCPPTSLAFGSGFSDIKLAMKLLSNGVEYNLTTTFVDCRDAIIFERVIRAITFFISGPATPGVCQISVTVTDTQGISNVAIPTVSITVKMYDNPPFIDLDLGRSGRDYSTIYYQGGPPVHVVSILNETLKKNLTKFIPLGEAPGEAPVDDISGFSLTGEQSYAGYILEDLDSPILEYLQLEFIFSTTLVNDAVAYPCVPANLSNALDPRGCTHDGQMVSESNLVCNDSLFGACHSPIDLCNDLTVTIFCSGNGRKAYRFQYRTNSTVLRYYTLLGYLGYKYLLDNGGSINQIRLINITASDGEKISSQAIAHIQIQNNGIVIINAPSFPVPAFDFPENVPVLSKFIWPVYQVNVTNRNGSIPAVTEIEFGVKNDSASIAFGITRIGGQIFPKISFDRERIPYYLLTVSAHRIGAPAAVITYKTLYVKVDDVNDNAPQVPHLYTVNVYDGIVNRTVVQIIATDADEGINAELTYLPLGIGVEDFRMSSTGLVTTSRALNASTMNYYLIVVYISDRGTPPIANYTVININVVPVPATRLALNGSNITVLETVLPGYVLETIVAYEANGLPDLIDPLAIRYRLVDVSPMSGATFTVNSTTGQLIFSGGQLNAKVVSQYRLTVQAYSISVISPPQPGSITVAITVTFYLPPVLNGSPFSGSVSEKAPGGTVVLVINDTIAVGNGFSFSLNTVGVPFSVTPNGTVVVSGPLDYETTQNYTLSIHVVYTSPEGNTQISSAMVKILILDENDNGPFFSQNPYRASVLNTAQNGTVVLTIITTDLDSPINSQVTYTVYNTSSTPFCQNGSNILVCNSFLLRSWQQPLNLTFTIVAVNNPAPGLTGIQTNTTEAILNLLLVNQYPPVFDISYIVTPPYYEKHCNRTYPESCSGVQVYRFSATDKDPYENIRYSLATPSVPFAIDPATGWLGITGTIVRAQAGENYTLTIYAISGPDFNGTVFTATATLVLPILGIDDSPPTLQPPFYIAVNGSQTSNTSPFAQVNITDQDSSSLYKFYVSIPGTSLQNFSGCNVVGISTMDQTYFPISISAATGQLSFCKPVDVLSDKLLYVFTVTVTDTGYLDPINIVTYVVQGNYSVEVTRSNTTVQKPVITVTFSVIRKNVVTGTAVGNISATGRPGAQLSYAQGSTCSPSQPFRVNRTTGVITTCQPLNYGVYNVSFTVCDTTAPPGALCGSANVSVTVIDANVSPPVFSSSTYYATMLDTATMNQAVLNVSTTDNDSPANSIVYYSILTIGSPFSINRNTGVIYVSDPNLLYANKRMDYTLIVQAFNPPALANDANQTANASVIIMVLDISDITPIIAPPTQFSVYEGKPVGILIGCISAVVGNSRPISYYIQSQFSPQVCTGYTPFRINTTTGCFYSCAIFDYENATKYNFGMVACADMPCSNLTTITVNIVDLNDNPPVFSSDPIVVSMDENVNPGYNVTALMTTDADSLVNSMVTYFFTNITTAPFIITNLNEVHYTGIPALNYNAITSYILGVRATNPSAIPNEASQYADVVLIININPRNTFPPVFLRNNDTVTIDEASVAGTVVYMLDTTDADAPLNSKVYYTIANPVSSAFATVGNNVSVFNSSALLSLRPVQLTITAINPPDTAGDKVLTANFTLNIFIVHAPIITSIPNYMLLENFTVERMFYRISANNLDSGLITFSIQHNLTGDPTCNEIVPVIIDEYSGWLSLCRQLDYEMESIIVFPISACTTVGTIKKCTTFNFTLYVLDSNDYYPQITSLNNFTVFETASFGTKIGCLSAIDLDTGLNQVLRFNFLTEICTTTNPFVMNQTAGCIYVCQPLDYTKVSSYILSIAVCDLGSLCTYGNISIQVQYVNRYAPIINSSSVANVPEGIAGALVITVTAYDNDLPPFNTVTYSLLNNSQGLFYINPNNGSLYTAQKLFRANQTVYYVGVVAADGYLNATQIITVFLIPSNMYPPVYNGNQTLYELEETPLSVFLYFTGSDAVAISYSVLTPGFTITQTGTLTNATRLDRDPATGGKPTRTIQVVATSLGTPPFPSLSTTVNLTLILIDINDNAPMVYPPLTATIFDGTKAGTVLLTINATDYDVGNNALLDFTVQDSNFAVNVTTGVIYALVDLLLTSSTAQTFVVTALISDHGSPSLATAVNYTFYLINSNPIFLSQGYVFSTPENSLGVLAFSIKAIDRDLNPYNNIFNFSILYVVPYDTGFKVISINDTGYFYTPSDYFDYEDTMAFNMVIGVGRYNLSYMQVSNTTFVTLNVTELNDNVPVLLFPVNLTGSIPEGAPVGYLVTTAYALDYDSGVEGDVTFYFSGSGQQYFTFSASGSLVISRVIPTGMFKNFTFTYFGCDNGIPQHCSANGTIFVAIVNVVAPQFVPNIYTISISENFGPNQALLTTVVSDTDTPLDEVVLSLSPPQPNFEIVQVTGVIMTTGLPLDNSVTKYSFSVVAIDPTGLNGTASVVITIDNTNRFRPYVTPLQSTVTFNESGSEVHITQGLSIVDILSPSVYPLTQVKVELHTSPTDSNPYIFNGVCDHANYSFLFNNNSFMLCNVNTCQYILQTSSIVSYNTSAVLQNGILSLQSESYVTSTTSYAASQFTTNFSVSAWVLLQGTPLYIFQLVGADGVSQLALKANSTGLYVTSASQTWLSYTTTYVADGQWHYVALVRQNAQLILYLDGTEAVRGSAVNTLAGVLSVRLGPSYSGQLSEVYLCSSSIQVEDVFCVYTCGESLDVPASAPNTTVSIGARAHFVTIQYSGPPSDGLSAIQTTLRYVRYYNSLLEPNLLPRGVFVSVYDSRYLPGPIAILTLQITLEQNTLPILDLNGPLVPSVDYYTTFHELSSGQAILSPDATLYDRDSGYFTMQKIEVNLYNSNPTYESISFVPNLLFNISAPNNSSLTIVSSDPSGRYPSQFMDVLQSLRYVNLQDPLILANRTITFKVYDHGGLHTNNPLSQTTMNMVHTNHPPVLDLNANDPKNVNITQTLVQPMRSVQLLRDTSQSITDPDSSYIIEITVALVAQIDGANERVIVTGTPSIGTSVSYSLDGKSLNITGMLTRSNALVALHLVSYSNTVDNPSNFYIRIVQVTMLDEGGARSLPAHVLITIQQYSYPPVVYLGGPGIPNNNVTFFEKGSCVQVASQNVQIALLGGTLAVQQIFISAVGLTPRTTSLERIVYTGSTTSYTLGNLVILYFTQTNTISYVLQELLKVQYCNYGVPTVLSRAISVQADSFGYVTPSGMALSGAQSIPAYSYISIQLINDPPVLVVAGTTNRAVSMTRTAFVQPVSLTDVDSTVFRQLRITIVNIQDGPHNELIELSNLVTGPSINIFSIGPFNNSAGGWYYNVSFKEPGTNSSIVLSTIGALRYNNIAPSPIVTPPRTICIEVADQSLLFSSPSCVQVTIAPPNYNTPVFLNISSSLLFNFNEGTQPIIIGKLVATDSDTGLEGQVTYSIASVKAVSYLGTVVSGYNPFSIDFNFGLLTAPNGMSAESAVFYSIVVQAADLGIPSRSAQIVVNVTVNDINGYAPTFTGSLPYSATPQSELQTPPRVIFTVTATDLDITSPNNLFTFALQNYQSKFAIDPTTGVITSTAILSALDQLSYSINVIVTDQGTPPLSSSTIVYFQLIDINNNPAMVNQLTPALYVVQYNPTAQSIGPAMRITDLDPSGSSISSVTVTLTPYTADSAMCVYICQGVRVQQANLTSIATNIFSLATFTGLYSNLTLGAGNCSAVSLDRGSDPSGIKDGYGKVNRLSLPSNFGSGDFSFSFLVNITSEGYIFAISNTYSATPAVLSSVKLELALWIRRVDIQFSYKYGNSMYDTVINGASTTDKFFGNVFRHVVVVIRSATLEFYVDCALYFSKPLAGIVLQPSTPYDLFLGQPLPRPAAGGRFGGTLSGIYYYNRALTTTEIPNFCTCGSESIQPPTSLPTTTRSIVTSSLSFKLSPTMTIIPVSDVMQVLQQTTYLNTYFSPSFLPDRVLTFTVTEVGVASSSTTTGIIRLVSSDTALPIIDLNGLSVSGISYTTQLTEGLGAVAITSSGVRTLRTLPSGLNGTFSNITIKLVNTADPSEYLTARSSSMLITVSGNNTGTLSIIGPGIYTDFEPILAAVIYNNTKLTYAYPFVRNISFAIFSTNGLGNSPPSYTTVTVYPVDNVPVIGTNSSAVMYLEGDPATFVLKSFSISDIDNTTLTSALVTLMSDDITADMLTVTASSGITAVYNNTTGVLSLTGVATLSAYQATLQSLQFMSTENPLLDNNGMPTINLVHSLLITVNDGILNSNQISVDISLIPVDSPPTVIIRNTTLVFTEGNSPIQIAPTALITDPDNTMLHQMTIVLKGAVDNDFLYDGSQIGTQLTYGKNLLTNYVAILRQIVYVNNKTEPQLTTRDIVITVCDFDPTQCNVTTLLIIIQDINNQPPYFNTQAYTFSVTDNVTVGYTFGLLRAVDADSAPTVFAAFIAASVPFAVASTQNGLFNLVTTSVLNYYTQASYTFNIYVTDGVFNTSSIVTVTVISTNNPPSIFFSQPTSAIVVVGVPALLFSNINISISDPDIGDQVLKARLVLGLPFGSSDTLAFPGLDGYSFISTGTNTYVLTGSSNAIPLSQALYKITFITSSNETYIERPRNVSVKVYDHRDLASSEAVVAVTLISSPVFNKPVYNVSLLEYITVPNFIQVSATVSGGPFTAVLAYSVAPHPSFTINSNTGYLSLIHPLDHDIATVITLNVYAVESLPTNRTGTAVVNVYVLPRTADIPVIQGPSIIFLKSGVLTTLFPNITISDPSSLQSILTATVTINSATPLLTSPLTGQTCEDEPNAVKKMSSICHLGSYTELLQSVSPSTTGASISNDSYGNIFLQNQFGVGYASVLSNLSAFEGIISSFTLAFWFKANPGQSGFIFFYSKPDSTERYITVYYDAAKNDLRTTLKRAGYSGLQAQVVVLHKLFTNAADGKYHFVSFLYSARTLTCVMDSVLLTSSTVHYIEPPSGGSYTSKILH